jgi:alpha-D-xyloside xylohydrolase
MKFTNGQWLTREGYQIHFPVEVRDCQVNGATISILASCVPIVHRGATLGGPVIRLTFSTPLPDIIRVQAAHFTGGLDKGPHFELNAPGNPDARVDETEEAITLTSGKTSVTIAKKGPWSMTFCHDGVPFTNSASRCLGYVIGPDKKTWFREQLALGVGESIYGLGEHFTPFVKNGQVVDIWNEDGGTSSEQGYKSIPFHLSNRGYGVFVNDPGLVSYEVGSEKVSRTQFSVAGEAIDYFVVGGGNPKKVLENYTNLTGKPSLPPAWSFGLWLTTSFTTNYDEQTVMGFVDGMAERDLPLHVFHFDCFWMKEYHWCDFKWDPAVFPDPEGMLRRMKEKGLKICVWINPYIAQQTDMFEEGKANGYLIKRPDGSVWQWDMWQPGMGIVDFTNPAACDWYAGKLKALMDMGVDSFKTDFGERIPTDVVYHDGSDPVRMHNYYTQLYNKCVFDLLEKERGIGEACLFARSATAGGQQYPVHWGGDCWGTFESMAESLRGGLSLTLSGFGFWSHDIGGFEDTAHPSVYKRWAAFGLLSSHSRLHGSSSYRVPWMFGDEAVDVVRKFTKLKCSLMPYLFGTAVHTAETGVPAMRAMVLDFPEDPACDTLDRQYMLGDSLLVAPVFRHDNAVQYYLPAGRWTHFLTNTVVDGGRWVNETHDFLSIPLMARPGSLIPVGANDTVADYDLANEVTLHLFELADGQTANAMVPGLDGKAELTVSITRNGDTLNVESSGAGKPWNLLLRNIVAVKGATGAVSTTTTQGTLLKPAAFDSSFTVLL